MIVTLIWLKIKSFLLACFKLLRRALCCLRRRKRSFAETVPLTQVVSNAESGEVHSWENDWGDDNTKREPEPKTVQDYIDLYRQQTAGAAKSETSEEELNFFEDMTPRITKQTKLFIPHGANGSNPSTANRLNFVDDSASIIPSSELREWDETTGWDGELLDQDAQKELRQQKRLERERKAWEQHQKRLEKANKSLGLKLNT
ncbi:receptor-binding cancer antigen expressed on SiSo cells [Cylas formicarius]|uniref:receptor-binding cancer antigen expressed on SiSo cells n=1 Tax=Cylas formicarius TaxID=197179 RepID=UPI0029588568|nr:receptor-binding cancer antigen expressed on SiSo cells [Cylas formicarius]